MSSRKPAFVLAICITLLSAMSSSAAVQWRNKSSVLAHNTGPGQDILGGVLKRNDTASDTLYFKFHVDPLSDVGTEEYFAGFQLYEGNTARLGVGNSQKAWAYSAFNTSETGANNTIAGDMDLKSSRPEVYDTNNIEPYELPRRGIGCTIVFRVQYVPGTDDVVIVVVIERPSFTVGEKIRVKTFCTVPAEPAT